MCENSMDKKDNEYTPLTPIERGRIEELRKAGGGIRAVARILERSVSTISEEIKRGKVHQIKQDKGVYIYYADTAQHNVDMRKIVKIACNAHLKKNTQSALAVALKAKARQHSVDTFTLLH